MPRPPHYRGPLLISDLGKSAYVLLSIEESQRLAGKPMSIVEALSMPGLADIELQIPRSLERPRPADFS